MTKFGLKLLITLAAIACASQAYADECCESDGGLVESSDGTESSDFSSCCARARARAIEIDAAISATIPLVNPTTGAQAALAFTNFFVPGGVFSNPTGLFRGQLAIYNSVLAYANSGIDTNQRVIPRKYYWDPKTSTLTVERTWFANVGPLFTPTGRDFCGTVLPVGTSYSQDDVVVIRFACDRNCENGCTLPGSVVYYAVYFDQCQFQSRFTDVYPPVCHCIGEECEVGNTTPLDPFVPPPPPLPIPTNNN